MDSLPISFRLTFAKCETVVEACYGPSLGEALYRATDLVIGDPEAADDQFEFHDCMGRVLLRCAGSDLQIFAARVLEHGGMGAGAPHRGQSSPSAQSGEN